ncbi:MAG: hypothetical protein NTW19_25180 [Planctomycetota bacterium]|nr:hypothetical protein [Planctomycetota bacterium]
MEHWTAQIPRLLEPLGIAAYVAQSVEDAISLAEQMEIHAAVVDLSTPLGETKRTGGMPGVRAPNPGRTTAGRSAGQSGLWLLEMFRRLPNHPPVVVIHGPAADRREGDRLLSEALRLGAFSVLAKPVEIEQILAVFRRVLDRQYRGSWPGGSAPG